MIQSPKHPSLSAIFSFVFFLLIGVATGNAKEKISATFGEAPWDGFEGEAGGGWTTPWIPKSAADESSTLTAEVVPKGGDSLVPGQPFLRMTYHRAGNEKSASRSGISRQWDTSALSSLDAYSVKFSIRFADLSIFQDSHDTNSINIAANKSARANASITEGISLWFLQFRPGQRGWAVIKKDDPSASEVTTFYFKGDVVPQEADLVYTIQIDVYRTRGEFDVTINGVSASSQNDGILFHLSNKEEWDAFDWLTWQINMVSNTESGASFVCDLGDIEIQGIDPKK